MKRTLAGAADRVVLAVDAAKLGARSVAVGLEWDAGRPPRAPSSTLT